MRWTCLLAVSLLISGAALAAPAPSVSVVSTGREIALTAQLVPEKPTVFVFLRPSSSAERAFLEEIRKGAGDRIGLRTIQLQTGAEPVAKQYEVKETPTAIVYDRRGRLVARTSDMAEMRAAVMKAAAVMRIDWVEEGDPRMDEVEKLLGRRAAPGILRTMSLKPEYLKYIHELSRLAHFSDGFLDRRTKEMIATHVSALNKCRY